MDTNRNIFRRYSDVWFYAFIFVALWIFFTQIHPLVPFDTDDWLYMGNSRTPFPSMSEKNPTKVFCELSEPLVANIGAFVIMPIVGDWVTAQIHALAITLALFIVIYLLLVQRLVTARFHLDKFRSYCIISLFVLLHFLMLRTRTADNDFLWYSRDVTCYFHYTLPNLLNASLVLWLMRHNPQQITSIRTHSLLLLTVYLALCSSLYASVILIAYVGALLIGHLVNALRSHKPWLRSYVRDNYYYLAIIVAWMGIQLFEINGNRANAYGNVDSPFLPTLLESARTFANLQYCSWFIVLTGLVVIAAKVCSWHHGHRQVLYTERRTLHLGLALLLSIAYLILLSSKVFPAYLRKGDVVFCYAFFALLIFVWLLGYLCARSRHTVLILPLTIFCVFFKLNSKGNTFRDVQHWNRTDAQTCIQFSRDVVQQVRQADAQSQDTCVITVPYYNDGSNWPFDYAHSQFVGKTLFQHNVTRREIVTIFQCNPPVSTPVEEVTEEVEDEEN